MKERHEYILGEVVKAYLETGLPVGSRMLSEHADVGLSPASVRNAMADLERMGLLCAPHTSAGRKPTDVGIRYFVDSLMVVDADLQQRIESNMGQQVGNGADVERLLKQASDDLASLTHFAGLVSVHEHGFACISKVELVPISSEQLLVVVVSEDGEVQNRLIRRSQELNDELLLEASRRINELVAGRSLEEARTRLEEEIRLDRLKIRELLEDLKRWTQDPTQAQTQLMLSGQSQLLETPEFGVIETVRSLFLAFEEKEDLLSLLQQVEQTESGVKVFIGSEHALVDMEEVSVVLSRYEGAGQTVGTLGVIGPKRMHYDRVLPIVDCTARWVSRMLGGIK
ncbi:MAG: heat-inducible transcriptional repressor HrcA [Mariprofundaceae bacterium]